MVGSTQRLELRQGQSLVMTQQLQQSLKLLQCSNQELLEFVEAEIQQNPLLEKTDNAPQEGEVDTPESDILPSVADSTDVVDSGVHESMPSNADGVMDVGYEGTWDSNGDKSDETSFKSPAEEAQGLRINTGVSDSAQYGGGNSFIEQISSEEPSLREHLQDQVAIDFDDQVDKIIASFMIDGIDASGYYTADLAEIAGILDCKLNDVKRILTKLQKCDPVGIFAKDLQESLALQLKDKDRLDPAMAKLVSNLELLAKGELKKLRKLCRVDIEDFEEMLHELKQLNPRPASKFSTEISQTAQIDIFLRQNPNGTWAIELNNDVLPKVLVNNRYYSEVKKKTNSKHEKEFLQEQYNTANWLVKTLNQRAETILKVTTEIVAQQSDFFEKGIYFLKPMVLADIAKIVGVHESTVGRVTNNKYISTPRGVFELKYFFSSSISNSVGDEDFSSKTVKFLIKELIDEETDHKSVLSDDKISEILKAKGIDVARRTVAKYRESINIPTSSMRKRQKKMQAGLS